MTQHRRTAPTSGNIKGPPRNRMVLWGEEEQRSGTDIGPTWPDVVKRSLRRRGPKWQGLGKALPNKQFSIWAARQKWENMQVSIHLPCLRFSGKPI